MPGVTIPSLDQELCGAWTPQDIDFYNRLPFYLQEGLGEYRQNWSVIRKLLTTTPWKVNQGDTMRRVIVEPSPVLRQNAIPNLLSQRAKMDIHTVRERKTEMKIRWQKFRTPEFTFLPSFQDFMKGNIKPNMDNLNRQISIYEDQFYETYMWNWAPNVYVAGVGLIGGCPQGDEPDQAANEGKYDGFVQSLLTQIPADGGFLTATELWKALNVFEEEIGGTPYEGSGLPNGDSAPLDERYCLVQSPQSYNCFQGDPWVTENRPLALDIVTAKFRGDLFGRIRSKLWRYPRRIRLTNAGVPSYEAPETWETNSERDDYGRTIPNPIYAKLTAEGSQFEVAWLMGGQSFQRAEGLAPPPPFNAGVEFKGMRWDGRAYLTDNFMTYCTDENGVIHPEPNSWGEYLRLQSALAMGCTGDNKFNALPILFKRRSGVSTVTHVSE